MKLYDRIRKLLEAEPRLRDSDKHLIWVIWKLEGKVDITGEFIRFKDFKEAISPETIRRTRQKVQADHLELASSPEIQREKDRKEQMGGNFVYQERLYEKD